MDTTLLTVGIACVIASVVGGGLKAFGIEIPIVSSRGRQILLFVAGCVFLFKPVYDLVRPSHPSRPSVLITGIAESHRGPVWDHDFSSNDEVVAKVTGEAHLECGGCRGVSVVAFWRLAQGFETNWHVARRRDEGWYRLAKIDGPVAVAGSWDYLIGGIECPKDYSGEVAIVLAALPDQFVQQHTDLWLGDQLGNGFRELPYEQALAVSAPRTFHTARVR